MKSMPKTARTIYRLGRPIPYPTTIDEYRALLIWALDQIHEHNNATASYPGSMEDATLYPDTAISDSSRLGVALLDPRFMCRDEWHLRYQPGNDRCPTCTQDWIVT